MKTLTLLVAALVLAGCASVPEIDPPALPATPAALSSWASATSYGFGLSFAESSASAILFTITSGLRSCLLHA